MTANPGSACSLASRDSVACRHRHVTVLPDSVAPTIIVLWREFLVSYSWITFVTVSGRGWYIRSFSSASTAAFICTPTDNSCTCHLADQILECGSPLVGTGAASCGELGHVLPVDFQQFFATPLRSFAAIKIWEQLFMSNNFRILFTANAKISLCFCFTEKLQKAIGHLWNTVYDVFRVFLCVWLKLFSCHLVYTSAELRDSACLE